jgi:hypothetical protein
MHVLSTIIKNQMTVAVWVCVWVFYSVTLVFMPVFVPVPCWVCLFVPIFYCCARDTGGIYNSSYSISNISYLNSPLHHSPLSPPSHHSWNSFNRPHFSIYIHLYIVFAPYSSSYTLSPHPPHSHWYK